MTTPSSNHEPQCANCEYNLKGLNDDGSYAGTCPECGATYDLRTLESANSRKLRRLNRWHKYYFRSVAAAGPVVILGGLFENTIAIWIVMFVCMTLLFFCARSSIALTYQDLHSDQDANNGFWVITFITHAIGFAFLGVFILIGSIAISVVVGMLVYGILFSI